MKVGDLVKIDKYYGGLGIWLVTMIDDNWAHIAKGKHTNISVPLVCLEKVE